MKISVISFTETGQQLAERIRESMDGETAVTLYTKCSRLEKKTVSAVDDSDADTICVRNSLSAWAGEQMAARQASFAFSFFMVLNRREYEQFTRHYEAG